MSSHLADFDARNKNFSAKLFNKSIGIMNFGKFFRRHSGLVSKYDTGIRSLLQQGLSDPEFYGDLRNKFRQIVGKQNFLINLKKIIMRYKFTGYNVDRMRQSA